MTRYTYMSRLWGCDQMG
uniref:Uncharacterized protein n=1 Tax=Arundo donax TaxID=35708 RepID=A0A0A9C1C5_ARUDO